MSGTALPPPIELSKIKTGPTDDEDAWVATAGRACIQRMFVQLKNSFLYAPGHDALKPTARFLAEAMNSALEQSDGGVALQFLEEGIYLSRKLIKLDTSSFEQAQYLFGVWSAMGIAEVAVTQETDESDWLQFFGDFRRCITEVGRKDEFATMEFPIIRMRALKSVKSAGIEVTDGLRALRAYAVLVTVLEEHIDLMAKSQSVKPSQVKRALQDVVSVANSTEALLLSLGNLAQHKKSWAHHLANTALFAIVIGRRLGLNRIELRELGMAAAFHDVGVAFLPQRKTDIDRQAWARRAARESMRKLAEHGVSGADGASRVVVADEVERVTESNADEYPFQINARSKLIAVAHAYDMLTTPKEERKALLPDEALCILLRDAGRRYDEHLAKLLVSALGVFPVGSMVQLSTGETAVVLEAPRDPAMATKPRVKIIKDQTGGVLDGQILDLAGPSGAGREVLHCVHEEQAQVNPCGFLLS